MDAESTVRLAVIGAGRWGSRYISTIVENPGTFLQCVVSRSELTRGLVPDSCDVVQSWQQALARDDLNGIIVATPPHTHFDIAMVALERSLPVIVEKPMTLDLEQAHALRRQAEAAGVPFLVGHVHLFSPAFARMKRELTTLGPIRRIRSVGANQGPIRIDTPPMWDYGPHDLAMTLDILADRPSAIAASLADRVVTTEGCGEAIKIDLDFGEATRAEINVSNIAKRRIRLFEVQTDTCSVVYDDTQDQKLKRRNFGGTADCVLDYEDERPLTRLVREFASAIRERRATPEALSLGCAVIDILAHCQKILTGTARP